MTVGSNAKQNTPLNPEEGAASSDRPSPKTVQGQAWARKEEEEDQMISPIGCQ